MGFLDIFKRRQQEPEGELPSIYAAGSPTARIRLAQASLSAAKSARAGRELQWKRYNDYYNFLHDATQEIREAMDEDDLQWDAAVVPDAYLQVESQIDPSVPEPEFRGRDDDLDSERAKQREDVVRYILQRNNVDSQNTANERRLVKLGDAFWHAWWDPEEMCGINEGDIKVNAPAVETIYMDPTAGDDGLQAGQYVIYCYALNGLAFWRRYGEAVKKQGKTLEEMLGIEESDGQMFDLDSDDDGLRAQSDACVWVTEYWYKQPEDTEEAEAGDVAVSIQAGGLEVQYIPRYWAKTHRQNKLFPFVHYWRIRDENSLYNKSELFSMMDLIDAADRELGTAIYNDAMTNNDIILMEEKALADGEEATNIPGAIWTLRQNTMGKVQRLGGLGSGARSVTMIGWLQEQMQRASRNFETNLGKETSRATTASALAMMREDADRQTDIKRSDRNEGFKRLFQLLDWMALEFYDDERVIFLGAVDDPIEDTEPTVFRFRGDDYAVPVEEITDPETGEVVREAFEYWPEVDVDIDTGTGTTRNRLSVAEFLDKLAATPINEDNWRIVASEMQLLDIPNRKEIVQQWRDKFQPVLPPEVMAAAKENPQIAQLMTQVGLSALQAQQIQAEQAPAEPMMAPPTM